MKVQYVTTDLLFIKCCRLNSFFFWFLNFFHSFQTENVDVFMNLVSHQSVDRWIISVTSRLFSAAANRYFLLFAPWQPIITANCP